MAKLFIAFIFLVTVLVMATGVAVATPPARPDDVLWSKTLGGNGSYVCYSIARTPDGGYVIGGMSNAVSPMDAYAAKVDQNGSLIWQNNYPDGIEFNAVTTTPDGNYLFAGKCNGVNNSSLEGYLVKTGPNGNLLFAKTYGIVDSYYEFVDLVQEADGIIILGSIDNRTTNGLTVSGGLFLNVWKTDADGNQLWSKAYSTGGWKGYGIVKAPDGGYAIAGAIKANDSSLVDAYLLRIDSEGNKLWDASYPGKNNSIFFTICNAGDDGYLLAGNFDSINKTQFFINRVTLNGTVLWNRTIDVPRAARNAIQASDGGFVFACGRDILRVNKDGIVDWERSIGTANDSLECVAEASDGSYVFGGSAVADNGNRSAWLVDIGYTQGPGITPEGCCWPALILPTVAVSIVALRRRRPA